ncbi:hypothetical protein BXY66_2169 [Shimia isoporae]|uniref:Uncharacterized protein n=1 Tax=Shimia isoporae TaxID=647720 RepID=A0A4R1NQJ0_9RHOB|nr:hypothetical protein [Shimia isoporae]TCL10101.1 hypothetical protein BXY66_2169 [Shimia isoporae]
MKFKALLSTLGSAFGGLFQRNSASLDPSHRDVVFTRAHQDVYLAATTGHVAHLGHGGY